MYVDGKGSLITFNVKDLPCKLVAEVLNDKYGIGVRAGSYCVYEFSRKIMNILSELNIQGDIEHVRDIREIGKYGVMGTPALIINGVVIAVGNVPPKTKLIEWIKEALNG